MPLLKGGHAPAAWVVLLALALHTGAALSQGVAGIQRPHIVVLTTGGTIAGQRDARSPIGYNSAQLDASQLIRSVPGLDTLARMSAEPVAAIGSQDMTDAVWMALAARITSLLADDAVDGIVVTHGTDTMEETAFFLDLVLPHAKPVVLVGAMRPASALSADGPANLYDAVRVAASAAARNRGVLVVMNGTIHGARDVEKSHATALETFRSPNYGPMGYVDAANVRFSTEVPAPRPARYSRGGTAELPRVDIVFAHAQMDGADIRDAVARGARGLVLAGVGAGNCSKAAIRAFEEAAVRGVVVVRASRTGAGFVDRNVEIDDDRLGFVAALDLTPQKARVFLQLLITNGITDAAAVQRAFSER